MKRKQHDTFARAFMKLVCLLLALILIFLLGATALFQQVLASNDDAEQTALYKQMEQNLTENAANVYIQDLADLVAVRKGVEGVTFYPIYVLDLANLHYTA